MCQRQRRRHPYLCRDLVPLLLFNPLCSVERPLVVGFCRTMAGRVSPREDNRADTCRTGQRRHGRSVPRMRGRAGPSTQSDLEPRSLFGPGYWREPAAMMGKHTGKLTIVIFEPLADDVLGERGYLRTDGCNLGREGKLKRL